MYNRFFRNVFIFVSAFAAAEFGMCPNGSTDYQVGGEGRWGTNLSQNTTETRGQNPDDAGKKSVGVLGKVVRTVKEHPIATATAAVASALVATGDPFQFIENHHVTTAAAVAAYGVYSCTTCAMQKQENEHELKKA